MHNTIYMTHCIVCGKLTPYKIVGHMVDDEIRGIRFQYVENTAYCKRCGTKVYIPDVNDWNEINRKESYERGKEEKNHEHHA